MKEYLGKRFILNWKYIFQTQIGIANKFNKFSMTNGSGLGNRISNPSEPFETFMKRVNKIMPADHWDQINIKKHKF